MVFDVAKGGLNKARGVNQEAKIQALKKLLGI
jgi:hypothetical protein